MIKYLGYSTVSALQFVKSKRPHIMPNFGFLQQLKNYEEKIKFQKDDLTEENNDNDKNINKFIKTEQRFIDFLKNNPV